ncbi:hypothetical protein GCM10027578_36500 [Spirosoma luteolum]
MYASFSIRPLTWLLPGLILTQTLVGCQPTNDARPAENGLTTYIGSESTLQQSTRSSGPWELGVLFSASVAGRLTQLGSKMPEPGTYRVIVWDADSRQLLRQKTIEQTATDKLTLTDVESLPLTANKKYMISINSQSAGTNKKYGYAYKAGGTEFMPFTRGNLLFYNAAYSSTATATYPAAVSNVKAECYGFPEFTFIAD